VVLLDDVVAVLDLANLNGDFLVFNDLIDGRFVGTTLVYGDFLRNAICLHCLFKEPHCCLLVTLGSQQEVYGFTGLVDGPIKIFPLAVTSGDGG